MHVLIILYPSDRTVHCGLSFLSGAICLYPFGFLMECKIYLCSVFSFPSRTQSISWFFFNLIIVKLIKPLHSELNELPLPPSVLVLLVLSVLLVHFAQFVPEEQGQDSVWSEPEVRGSQTFVESRQALLPQRLGKAVGESLINQPLKHDNMTVS